MSSMLEQLMELPLFNGVSMTRMAKTVGELKFHFMKFPKDETVIHTGTVCENITFILSGSVRSTLMNHSGRFAVSQTLRAPAVISPEYLFGKVTAYPNTVVALENTSVLQISKNDYIKMLNSDPVFLFNYLNTLSVTAQKGIEGILSLTAGDIDQRLAYWIATLTQKGGEDIELTGKKRDLYTIFGVQRSSFDNAIERLASAGIVESASSTLIKIKDRPRLLSLLNS